jgi:TonB family protein
MRRLFFAALVLTLTAPCIGQTAANASQDLPMDPRKVIAAAAPFYDFSAATLKPWHLKATYQLYDDKGDPSEQGTYEYWWVFPTVYRSSWTRPGATYTEWHAADGKHAHLATGEPFNFFEFKLQGALLSPIPGAEDLDPKRSSLDRETVKLGDIKLPCVMVIPKTVQRGQMDPLGLFPTYCFDPQNPDLRVSYSFGTITTEFNRIVKVQNRYISREILMFEGKRKILSATVDSITFLDPSNPALTPAPDAEVQNEGSVPIAAGVAAGFLLKKQIPGYPQDAKAARVSGTVVLEALIGMDGGVHDLRVVSAPWPSLAASALWAVSHWQYKPYRLNGEPVEVKTTVNVIYTLGP